MTLITHPLEHHYMCDCHRPGCAYCDSDGTLTKHFEEQLATLKASMQKKYVAGFLFSEDLSQVALIRKTKPAWQAGFYNAIGGKCEPGEDFLQTMRREFLEETNVEVENWQYFCTLEGDYYVVKFYVATGDLSKLQTTTEEQVDTFYVNSLPQVIPNLKWMVPMILDLFGRLNPHPTMDQQITAIDIATLKRP